MKKIFKLLIIALLTGLGLFGLKSVSAANAADFNPGRIIDDAVFTNKNAMSVWGIQNFLNNKMTTCDVWGVETSEYGGGTRAQYGTSRGYPPPYTCLKDFSENGLSAPQIIWNKAQEFSINPQVLVVLLQKEQGLVTDEWPFPSQYRSATGYGCPDSTPGVCDSSYYGFTNQVHNAARMYRKIMDADPNWYTPYLPGNNTIKWHPDSGCGTSQVYIHNRSTAALYSYTPYRPNSAALSNLYGFGDGCSSYGNRNFWREFTDWFGNTHAINASVILSRGLELSGSSLYVGDSLTASFKVQNTASFDIDAGGLGVCARINGQYYDLGFIHHQIIPASSEVTVSFTKQLDTPGTLSAFICSYNESLGGWASDRYPYDTTGTQARQATANVLDNPLVTTGVSLSPANPAIGQAVTATMTIGNASTNSLNIGSMVIAGRSPSGGNVDFEIVNDVIVPAGGSYTYSKSRTFNATGSHTFFIANWKGAWNTTYPKSFSGSIIRQMTVNMLDNPLVSVGISLSPASPNTGQPVTATMTLRNVSPNPINIGSMVIAGRNPSGGNVDFGIVNDVIIPANGTYTYSQTRTFPATGNHTFFIANWNGVWKRDYPKSLDGSVVRELSAPIN